MFKHRQKLSIAPYYKIIFNYDNIQAVVMKVINFLELKKFKFILKVNFYSAELASFIFL